VIRVPFQELREPPPSGGEISARFEHRYQAQPELQRPLRRCTDADALQRAHQLLVRHQPDGVRPLRVGQRLLLAAELAQQRRTLREQRGAGLLCGEHLLQHREGLLRLPGGTVGRDQSAHEGRVLRVDLDGPLEESSTARWSSRST
jgi:hypothetical protein